MKNIPMSKTKAIKAARRSVGGIYRSSRTDYRFTAPYDYRDLSGPCEDIQSSDWFQAQAKRRAALARIALVLMGHDRSVIDPWQDGTTVAEMVDAGIAQAARGYPYHY